MQSSHSNHGFSWHSTALWWKNFASLILSRCKSLQHSSLTVLLRKLSWVPWPAIHAFLSVVFHSDHEISSHLTGTLRHIGVHVHHPPPFSGVILRRVLVWIPEEPYLTSAPSWIKSAYMYKYMTRQPTYRCFNVCRYIGCFLWAALHSVGLGYVVSSIFCRGLCSDASNDPTSVVTIPKME